MSRPETTVKPISFLFIPLTVPMQWATTPEEVPIWDTSRGCPWERWRPHEEGAVRLLSSPDWEVRPPPSSGYPRLVRCSLQDRFRPTNATGQPILNDLNSLYRYVEPWKAGKPVEVLRKDVLRLSEKYGYPTANLEDNTLDQWLRLIAFVNTHLEVFERVHIEGAKDTGEWLLEERFDEPEISGTWGSGRLSLEIRNVDEYGEPRTLTMIDEGRRAALRQLRGAIKYPETSAHESTALRQGVAKYIYNQFGERVGQREGEIVTFRNFGVEVRCSAQTWLGYKLAEMWRGTELKRCIECGTLFAPKKADRIYCYRKTCADKVYQRSPGYRAKAEAKKAEKTSKKQKAKTT